jgi:hypothetical protein
VWKNPATVEKRVIDQPERQGHEGVFAALRAGATRFEFARGFDTPAPNPSTENKVLFDFRLIFFQAQIVAALFEDSCCVLNAQ